MDTEVRQALSDAMSEILVVAKAYDPAFLSEYVLQVTQTVEDEQVVDREARELANRYAAAFSHGDKDEEERGSP